MCHHGLGFSIGAGHQTLVLMLTWGALYYPPSSCLTVFDPLSAEPIDTEPTDAGLNSASVAQNSAVSCFVMDFTLLRVRTMLLLTRNAFLLT